MAKYLVNEAGVAHARELIAAHRYDFRRVHRMGIIAWPRPGPRPEPARGGQDEVLRLLRLLDATRA